ncbi:MAG: adenylate cyclase [Methyloprofundus sp.]|nr:MAG: adenylate cyclase [Methyloprofundus sp.]
MLHDFPLTINKALFFILACLVGFVVDYQLKTEIDFWIHDAAVVYQERTEWPHTGIVVLDNGVPINVGRKQALPLYAKAAERLIAAGAKGVFLDARIFKGMEGRMPFALCIHDSGQVEWSDPQCSPVNQGQCVVVPSRAGNAPLKMNTQAITHFSVAPYINPEEQDFLLYDWDAIMDMPVEGIVASDRLVTKNSPIARWLDLSADHAVRRLANFVNKELVQESLANSQNDELCDEQRTCRRVRLSKPVYKLNTNIDRLLVPLSVLASCNVEKAMQMAQKFVGKAVVMQVTGPHESTDILVSPMTTALFGPKLMTPGPQFIVDEVETFLNQDHPRVPNDIVKYSLFIVVALFAVLAGALLAQYILWIGGVSIFLLLILLCFLNPVVQLWPVVATMATFLTGAALTTGAHLLVGFKLGKLVNNYMPAPIRELLMTLPPGISFDNHSCQAVVLMSDLAGYTTVTSLLKKPPHVMDLMNDYLDETSIVLEDKYQGWLETYVGDLVCYYWPYTESKQESGQRNALGAALDQVILPKEQAFHHILAGALELAVLQHEFFSTLSERYQGKIDDQALDKISQIINAGIGITSGTVVMGALGPAAQGKGLKRFGILGDPLNLASRIEGLTRFFNTEIIITEELLAEVAKAGFSTRRLGRMSVKGRDAPAAIFALGYHDDPRFSQENILAWDVWLTEIETQGESDNSCPDIFAQDQQSILNWLQRGLLTEQGVWHLDQK